jgi:FixJ family two-component response regulator
MTVVTDHSPVIAVVDDEAKMRTALGRLLRTHGYAVALFQDGASLLAALAQQPFGCVLLDLHMPGLNGFSVLQALGALPRRPPVIVITGQDEPGNEARVTALGACAYLTKPVDEVPLLDALARNLETRPFPA